MLYNTEAFVIRAIPYGETHAIVTLLTPNGTVAAMARGAKKPQSRLAGGVQLCIKAVYTLYQGRGMGNIQQLEVLDAYRKLREQLDLSAYAAYFCELVAAVSEDRPNGSEVVYRWFSGALDRLRDGREAPRMTARIWEAKVLRLLGASPHWNRCIHCEGALEGSVAHYVPAEGGFVCSSCLAEIQTSTASSAYKAPGRSAAQRVIHVPLSVPRILEQFSQVPWDKIGEVRLGTDSEAAVRKILSLQLADYGGLSLKSREFVDSIDELWNQ